MAIDTAQKRMSVFQLPGLMTPPFPNGSVTAPDRQQISDVYTGISVSAVTFPSTTCWGNAGGSTSPWTIAGKSSNPWVNQNKIGNIWVDEKEVTPCQE